MTRNLPRFKGHNGTPYNFLWGKFGKCVLEKYNALVASRFPRSSWNLSGLHYENGMVRESDPKAVVLINEILRDKGLRIATPADLHRIMKTNALDLRGTYQDSAFLFESIYRCEDFLGGEMSRVLRNKECLEEAAKRAPVFVIPLVGLELVKDGNYTGTGFRIRDDAEIIPAPQLEDDDLRSRSYHSSEVDEATGIPTRLRNEGDRDIMNLFDPDSYSLFPSGLSGERTQYRTAGPGEGRIVVVAEQVSITALLHNK